MPISEKQLKNIVKSNNLNSRQSAFVQKYVREMKPASVAYGEAYDKSPADIATQANASRLIRNEKVKSAIDSVKQEIEQDAKWAYDNLKVMATDEKVPANVRAGIFDNILKRAGTDPAQKVEQKTEEVLPGLNDKKSKRELLQSALDNLEE